MSRRKARRKAGKILLRFVKRAHKDLCYECIAMMHRDLYDPYFRQDMDLSCIGAVRTEETYVRHGYHAGERRAYWQSTDVSWEARFRIPGSWVAMVHATDRY